MEIEITIKNYRCFPDSRPARIRLGKGYTALVGANNSGKSSLLKFFFEFRNLFGRLSSPQAVQDQLLQGRTDSFSVANSVFDNEEVFCNLNRRDLEIQVDFHCDRKPSVPIPTRIVVNIPRGTNTWKGTLYLESGPIQAKSSVGVRGTSLYNRNTLVGDLIPFYEVFKALADTLYVGPFRNAINVGATSDYFDIKVGQAFVKSWRAYKTGNVKKENEAIYRLTQDIQSIFEFQDLEINPSENDQTLQVFVNGKSYKLPELGSGLTQFILVLANAATRQPSYILIDEPELNLHPSLQLDFLTTLTSYAKEGILFSTQSIGLARASGDKIYSLRKVAEGESEITELESTPRLSEFLGELSFSGYRELGFDNVLLVEGTTEVKAIQQFLRLLKKDHKVLLLPLGGSQLINASVASHLEELKRISGNISALIDSERDAQDAPLSPSRQAFKDACEGAGVKCHVLERRATENYFSDKAIKQVKGGKYRSLGKYEARRDVSPLWPKSENWRIAREMTWEELQQTDLGRFLASI